MSISRRGLLGTGAALGAAPLLGRARAQSANMLKIGVLTDLSGPYQDIAGNGLVSVDDDDRAVTGRRLRENRADEGHRDSRGNKQQYSEACPCSRTHDASWTPMKVTTLVHSWNRHDLAAP